MNDFRSGYIYCDSALAIFLLGLLLLVAWPAAWAQVSQANIRGTVHDASGAVIPRATLKLVNVETRVEAVTTSNEAGDYLFLNLNPGTYTLEASSTGFASQQLKPFVLQVNQTSTLDFTLPVGKAAGQVVEVSAVGAGLQAASAELGSVLEARQVEDLPLNGRNFTSLFQTVPGVSPIVPSGSQTASYTTVIGPVIIPSVNGQTNRSDLFYLDGILDIETFGNAYAVQPIIDTIQDQKLQSHNDSAEFGGATGGVVNIATKAGTNQLHGSAWEFNKATSLQALPFFSGGSQSKLSQNQYGGTVGGPVIIPKLYNGRDKTFFFGSYEGYHYSSPSTEYFLVPTAAELAGDFTAISHPIYDPATTTCDADSNCTRQQFAYHGIPNMIDPARLNAGSLYYARYAIPGISNAANIPAGYNASQSAPTTAALWSYDARVDETYGQKNSGFFRVSGIRGPSTSGRSQLPYALITNGYQYVGGYVHIFSPTSVLHVQAGDTFETRTASQRFKGLPADFLSVEGFPSGLTSGFITLGNVVPGNQVSGYFSDTGESGGPQTTADGWSVKGDYNQVIGKHTIKLGAEFNKIGEAQDIQYANVGYTPNETSSGTGANGGLGGDALASFLIGVPGSATKRNLQETLGFGGVFGAYVQDQFQITTTLTLNFGVRYDLGITPKYGTPSAHNQASGNFDFNNGTYVVYQVPGPCATLGNAPCIPTADGSLPNDVVKSSGGKVLEDTPLNIQPRVGFAYRITPTTVVRGGGGVAFDEYAGLVQNIRGVSGNWPSVGQIQQGNLNTPTAADPNPNVTPQTIPNLTTLPSATPFGLQNWYVDPRMKNAYSLQWNLGVQRQINSATVVSATYVGSKNERLDVGGVYNVALTPGPGTPALRAPYPYITPTFYSRSNGRGDYNSLQLQLNRSFTHGMAATFAYTWQKSTDEACSGFFGSEGCDVQQIYNIKAERAVSAFDIPNNLVASVDYELPIGRGKALNIDNFILDQIVGGWQINGLASFHSGTPYSVHTIKDQANIGSISWWPYERANIVGHTNPEHRTASEWINTSAFAIPDAYTYGNMGRNSLRTQFSQNVDASLFKTISVERFQLELRAEAFNVLNHQVFGAPDSSLDDTAFGSISSAANSARQVQLGAKVIF